jgi:hypothetical protein
MQKFTYQTSVRMSENLRESMKDICDTYQINESDYIRRSLVQSVQNDIKNAQSADNKFLFV